MEPLTDQVLLDIWDAGINLSLIDKSLHLLKRSFPARTINEVASLTIGERDACLFEIRKHLFGSELYNVTACPHCSQKIEWQTSVESLCVQELDLKWEKKPVKMVYQGHQISFRIPNSADILEILTIENVEMRQSILLEKCLEKTSLPILSNEGLPRGLIEAVFNKMEECDPLADLSIDINCPECGHRWTSCFDIMWFLWSEIDNWAKKLIQDISILAVNFGWSEQDILGMSRYRRNLYINRIYA